MNGAQERTRTSTPLRELAPEASASANSATWALTGCEPRLNHIAAGSILCQRSTHRREEGLTTGVGAPRVEAQSWVLE